MFYYIVLFGVCLIVGFVVLWLYTEATAIGKKGRKSTARNFKPDPTEHLKGVLINTTINNPPTLWGGEGGLEPKHPARTQAAMPAKTTYWDLPGDGKPSEHLHAYPGGSKSESEFWNYLVTPDRPGHGTGIKPGHGTGMNPGHGTGAKPGHGTGTRQARQS